MYANQFSFASGLNGSLSAFEIIALAKTIPHVLWGLKLFYNGNLFRQFRIPDLHLRMYARWLKSRNGNIAFHWVCGMQPLAANDISASKYPGRFGSKWYSFSWIY